MEELRLQKYLAQCGVSSRRGAEQIIQEGRVTVNGTVVTEMGIKVKKGDKVTVDGQIVKQEKIKYYILLNKPAGVLSSVKDDRGRECVVDLIEGIDARLYPVGRLDYDTTGLLLLTNDGDFMQRVTHPSFEIWKTYQAVVKGVPTETDVKRFAEGIMLDDGKTLPAVLDVVGYKGNNAIVEVSIREGRNRQVRRMLERIGHPVNSLKRISFGSLELGDLKPGKWRHVQPEEIARLTEER
ncbi:MAG: rRNA pseudouridine synthase [Clostridia bacterium]|jgi:23S rRNA pseudouridine2605 synthase|nr:rRNA pseudouridine synthase [Clostridia bacterium]